MMMPLFGLLGLLASFAWADKPCPQPKIGVAAPQVVHDAGEAAQQLLHPAPDPLVAADAHWIHGASDCGKPGARTPLIQLVQVDADTFVMRQNMCTGYEAPFIYLYCGREKCVLMDTGDNPDEHDFPLRGAVDRILAARAAQNHLPEPQLMIAHTHSHGDHRAADRQFVNRPGTTVVGPSPQDVQQAWGMPHWPDSGEVTVDLGGRKLTAFPLPGHEAAHIAVYDNRTHDLLTGDTLYPGRLYVSNQAEFRASVARLDDFVSHHPVRHVLGAHIELAADNRHDHRHDFPVGSQEHPGEHGLLLGPEHVRELARVVAAQTGPLHSVVTDDFILDP